MTKSLLIFLLFFISLSYAQNVQYGCPVGTRLKVLSPCTCSQIGGAAPTIRVTCNGFRDQRKLLASLRGLHGYGVDELIISGAIMPCLPDDPFIDKVTNKYAVEIATIKIINSRLNNIGEPLNSNNPDRSFFTGLGSSLKTFIVENSQDILMWSYERIGKSLIKTPYFTDTTAALTTIQMSKNSIDILPLSFDQIIDGGTTIKPDKVVLNNNKIRFIKATLKNFENMRLLDLSNNLLENTYDLFLFTPATVVSGTVTPAVYKTPAKIHTLLLNNNKLTILKETDSLWKRIGDDAVSTASTTLKKIDLSNNPIDCHCSYIEWITSKKLDTILVGTCGAPPEKRGRPFTDCQVDN